MRNERYLDMLKKLLKIDETAVLPYDQIRESFHILGHKYDMGEGKYCIGVEESTRDGKPCFLIKGFMPKGSKYTKNAHPDADEFFLVVEGQINEKVFNQTKYPLERFIWRAGSPHNLVAITDSYFYALLVKTQ